jgi:hypothetical protein
MELNDKRNLVVRIFKKEERGLPRHAAVNSVLAGFSKGDRDEVVAQLAAEELHALTGTK